MNEREVVTHYPVSTRGHGMINSIAELDVPKPEMVGFSHDVLVESEHH